MFKKIYEDAVMPARATKGSAGYDMCVYKGATIRPGETVMFGTGIAFAEEIPGLFGQLVPRSSTFGKYSVVMPNSIGVIDSDYVDHEIKIPFTNISDNPILIPDGERVAQLIFIQYFQFDEYEVETERTGGHGSTDE